MKMREEKKRGLGQQRAEEEEEDKRGQRFEGSEEEAEKILRPFRYLKRRSLWDDEERFWNVEKGLSFSYTRDYQYKPKLIYAFCIYSMLC